MQGGCPCAEVDVGFYGEVFQVGVDVGVEAGKGGN
jgi:hypothetical protein